TAYNTAASIDLTGSITGVDITAVTIGTAPMHGTVSVSGETVTYTPSPTYYGGSDSFTYTATNPGGTSSAAMVSVTVTPLSVPVAKPLAVVTMAGEPVLVQAWAGATGPQPFTGAGVVTKPSHGSASASGGQITYVPVAGFTGSDTFGYEVINSFGHSLPATVTVTVLPVGSATGSSVTLTTTPGTPVSTNLAMIVPGSYVSSMLVGISPANAGNVALSQPSTLTFSPAPGFHGLVQLSAALVSANSSVVSVNVLVLVGSQPDPSKNPNVLGLINAQTEQAQRFAQSQLDNIHGRLESLHDVGGTASFSNSLSISLDGRPLQAPRSAASDGTVVPGGHPLADGNGWGVGTSNAWMRPGIGASEGVSDASTTAGKPVDTDSDTASRGSGGLGAWVGGTAAFGAFDAYRQAAGFDADNIAVNVGVDQRIGQRSLVGFSLGYNHDNSTIANDGTRSIAHGYSAAFYGSFQPAPRTYIDAVLGGGKLTFDSRRHDSDSGSFLSGQRDGKQWFASLTAGYEYHKDNWLVSPYGRLEWSLSTLDGFSENGTPAAALTYGNQTVRTSRAVLGLRASGQIQLSYGMLIPHARLEVGHDFQGSGGASLSYAFIPSAGSWNVLTNPYSANGTSAQLGLGLDLQLTHDLRLTTDYEYLTQPHAHVQMIRLGVSKQF
ncbi:MAG: autotransporter domain-containing protein, partial [Pseudomonadota bacterium]